MNALRFVISQRDLDSKSDTAFAADAAKLLPLKVTPFSTGEEGPMTKEDLVALADALRSHNRTADGRTEFTPDHLRVLADFCASQYPDFNRERWIDYITGVNARPAKASDSLGQQR